MKNIVQYACVTLICIFSHTFGYIYRIDILESNGQLIVGMSDYHNDDAPISQEHRTALEALCKRLRAYNDLVIVEDMHTYCGNNNTKPGVLSGLQNFCACSGIPCVNGEYRLHRSLALHPFLTKNSIEKNNCETMTCKQFLDEIRHAFIDAHTHAPTSIMRDSLKTLHDTVNKRLVDLNLDVWEARTVSEYINTHDEEGTDRAKALQDLLVFDSELLDHIIANTVLSAQNKSTIILVAGGAHIAGCSELLKKHGYKAFQHDGFSCPARSCVKVGNNAITGNSNAPAPINTNLIDLVARIK